MPRADGVFNGRRKSQLRSCTGSRSPGAAQPARGTLPHEANQGVAALASRRVAPALPLAAASASGALLVLVAALVPAEPAEARRLVLRRGWRGRRGPGLRSGR